MTAEALVRRIEAKGGRIFCMPTKMVFVLTRDTQLRDGLIELGGRYHTYKDVGGEQGYRLSRDAKSPVEWDIWCHMIPVDGESMYEAVRRLRGAVQEPGGSPSASGPVEA